VNRNFSQKADIGTNGIIIKIMDPLIHKSNIHCHISALDSMTGNLRQPNESPGEIKGKAMFFISANEDMSR